MKIDVLTLFPDMFTEIINSSIIKRAIEKNKVNINNKLVEVELVDLRTYSNDKHNHVDDTPYGGGAGMVLMCDPIFRAVDNLKSENSVVIMLSPQGKTYNQKMAQKPKEKDTQILNIKY